MKEKHLMWSFLIAGLSFLSSFFIIHEFFPFAGFSLSLLWFTIALGVLKHRSSRYEMLLLFLALPLSLFVIFRSNPVLVVLNISTTILLLSVVLYRHKDRLSFKDLVLSPLFALVGSMETKTQFPVKIPDIKRSSGSSVQYSRVLLSILITAVLLVIILPLLASANQIFANLLEGIAQSVREVFNFNIENVFLLFFRVILGAFIFFITTKLLSFAMVDHSPEGIYEEKISNISSLLLIPKVVVTFVLTVFFVTQVQIYFASPALLKSLGYSNAELTREVFGQLSVVSFIVFALIYLDRSRRFVSVITIYLLVALGIFLTAVGFKSVYDYIGIGGYTIKRLYGVSFIAWLSAAYLLFLYNFVLRASLSRFIKQAIVLTAITILGINIANFDYLIYHVRPSVSHVGIDYAYLADLSADGLYYRDLFEKLKDTHDEFQLGALHKVVRRIHNLQEKYKTFDLRTFNYAEYQQYLLIKDMNIDNYKAESGIAMECKKYFTLESALANIATACDVDLSGKNLTQLPAQIGELRNVKVLNLNNNQLTELPPTIGNLNNLQSLSVRQNRLVSLPAEIGKLNNLSILDVGQNNINDLPEELTALTELDTLNIDNNNIDNFPLSVQNWGGLNTMNAQGNRLPQQEINRIQFELFTNPYVTPHFENQR